MKPTPERIALLNEGLDEARNLMEMLSIDFHHLLKATLPHTHLPPFPPQVGILKKFTLTAQYLYDTEGWDCFSSLHSHTSDTLRSVACYIVGLHSTSLEEKFNLIKILADDPNSGVREFSFYALRPAIIQNPVEGIHLLTPWTQDSSERLRRFASEATRPRGVWCSHIPALKQEPWLALNLLTALKQDPARYVQLSVGNWLNDAGKDHPEWVKNLCQQWLNLPHPATEKICKRALRRFTRAKE